MRHERRRMHLAVPLLDEEVEEFPSDLGTGEHGKSILTDYRELNAEALRLLTPYRLGCSRGAAMPSSVCIFLEETPMPCNPTILRQVPLFALLDDEESAVLAGQVEVKTFAPRQRIYKIGDPGGQAYVMVSGLVRLTTIDEDHQEVVVDEPSPGEFFGFASMLEQTPHQTMATAQEQTVCIEVDRHDISILLERKPHAGMDMLTVLGRQFHASQKLVRVRANRNPNEIIEEEETFGERIADTVASFGGSWTFIDSFTIVLIAYSSTNVVLRQRAWDP